MGIKGLIPFLKSKCPAAFTLVAGGLEAYTGQRFAVDVSIFMYKFAYHKEPEDDSEFLESFLTQFNSFKFNGIQALYVFDGVAPAAKQDELAKRSVLRANATERAQQALATLRASQTRTFWSSSVISVADDSLMQSVGVSSTSISSEVALAST